MDIISAYRDGEQEREPYLRIAEMLADITMPWLKVRGRRGFTTNKALFKGEEYESLNRPFSNAGTMAVSSLASSIQSLLFGNDWFDLVIPLDVQLKLPPETIGAGKTLTAVLEQRLNDKMAEHGLYAQMGPSLQRLQIEGNVLVHLHKDFARVLPLRSFIVKRVNGVLQHVCIEEQIGEDKGEPQMLYTYVDYQKGKVYQQKSGQKQAKEIAASPKHYMIVTDYVPLLESYGIGYAWRFYGTIKAINDLSRDLQRIVKWMAVNLLLIDPSSNVTPRELIDTIEQGKDVLSAIPQEFSMFAAAKEKTLEIQYITAEIVRLTAELQQAFLVGLIGFQTNRDRVTATEILGRTEQVNSATQSLVSSLMATLQKPLVDGYMDLLDIKITLDGVPAVRPLIIAGSNRLSKLVQANSLIATLQAVASFKPGFEQRIDDTELFRIIAQAQGVVDAESLLLPPPPQGPTGPVPPQ